MVAVVRDARLAGPASERRAGFGCFRLSLGYQLLDEGADSAPFLRGQLLAGKRVRSRRRLAHASFCRLCFVEIPGELHQTKIGDLQGHSARARTRGEGLFTTPRSSLYKYAAEMLAGPATPCSDVPFSSLDLRSSFPSSASMLLH